MLAPSSIVLTGGAACAPLRSGLIKGLSERGAFFREDHIDIRFLRGPANRFCSARGAALAIFRALIYRHLDDFKLLTGRAGSAGIADGHRLFSGLMDGLSPMDLPLGPAHPWERTPRRRELVRAAAPAETDDA